MIEVVTNPDASDETKRIAERCREAFKEMEDIMTQPSERKGAGKLFGFALPIHADLDHREGGAHQIVDANGLALFFESTGWPEDDREKMAEWFASACSAMSGIDDPAAWVQRAKAAIARCEAQDN